MRILVCGGRNFGNLSALVADSVSRAQVEKEYNFILRSLDKLAQDDWPKSEPDQYGNWLPKVTIISGGASGVDSVAIDWAVVNWCPFEEFKADWKLHGRQAGPIRNQRMIDIGKPDLVVAFPGGNGTADMMRRARGANIKVTEIDYGQALPIERK